MLHRLDQRFLADECSRPLAGDRTRACKIAATLGPLQSIWLADEARELLGLERWHLPRSVPPGVFHVLVATRGAYPVLRPAFPLPLRWTRDLAEHSPRLPRFLRDQADAAVAIHRAKHARPGSAEWRLAPALAGTDPGSADIDLSGLEIEPTSAAAAMLAALELADHGVAGAGTVLASVACDDTRIAPVGHVADKLDAAVACGATRVFLDDGNRTEAEAWQKASGVVGLVRLLPAGSSLWESLRPFTDEAEASPPPAATLADLADYYQRRLLPPSRAEARRTFYVSRIVSLVAEQCLADPRVAALRGSVRCLVGCVPPGKPPLLALLAEVFRPEAVRMIHTPAFARSGSQTTSPSADIDFLDEHLRRHLGIQDVEPWPMNLNDADMDGLKSEIARNFAPLAAGPHAPRRADGMVVDLTAGPKKLCLALLERAPPTATCLLVNAEQTGVDTHRIGTERIEFVRG